MNKKRRPRKSMSFSAQMTRWEILLDELQKHLAEWPYLEEEYNKLMQYLQNCRQIDNQQEHLKGELKVLSQQLRQQRREGERVYAAIVRHLKAELGPRSPELTKFIPAAETDVRGTKKGWGSEGK